MVGAGNRNKRERYFPAVLFCSVLAVGLGLAVHIAQRMAHADHMRQFHDLHDRAVYFTAELQRLMAGYEQANQDIAAFVMASEQQNGSQFRTYVENSGLFSRLPGLRSVGYLPRVRPSEIRAFEQAMQGQYPHFRVWGQNYDQPFVFPLAYAVNPRQASRVEVLRGFDYASVIERAVAIEQVIQSGNSRATYMHQAISDREDARVILLFTPVFRKTTGAEPSRDIQGLVYSVLQVDQLFSGYGQGLIHETFDVELFEELVAPESLIYDGDGTTRVLGGRSRLPLIHRGELLFSGMRWLLFLYQRDPMVAGGLSSAYAGTLLAGVLLSLLLAYTVLRVHRHYKELSRQAWQAENFTSFFENHLFAVYSLDRGRRIVAANQQAEKELGKPRDELIGGLLDDLLDRENGDIFRHHFKQAINGDAVSYQHFIVTGNGKCCELAVVLVPLSVNGKVSTVMAIARNVTEKRRSERELHRSRQTLSLVLDNIPQLVFWKDAQGRYQGVNRRVVQFAGLLSREQIIGRTDDELPWSTHAKTCLEQDARVVSTGEPLLNHEEEQVQADGSRRWLSVSKVPIMASDGRVESVLAVVDDITERKQAEFELFRRANYDSLTGLVNRAYFYHQLEKVLAGLARASSPELSALLYFDIDHFKQINDSCGHGIGDRTLATFAARVSKVIRSTDTFARLGGDEFILLMQGADSVLAVENVVVKIQSQMAAAFEFEGMKLQVSTSIGVALYEPGMNADRWVKLADDTLYEVKRGGRNAYLIAGAEG